MADVEILKEEACKVLGHAHFGNKLFMPIHRARGQTLGEFTRERVVVSCMGPHPSQGRKGLV